MAAAAVGRRALAFDLLNSYTSRPFSGDSLGVDISKTGPVNNIGVIQLMKQHGNVPRILFHHNPGLWGCALWCSYTVPIPIVSNPTCKGINPREPNWLADIDAGRRQLNNKIGR